MVGRHFKDEGLSELISSLMNRSSSGWKNKSFTERSKGHLKKMKNSHGTRSAACIACSTSQCCSGTSPAS